MLYRKIIFPILIALSQDDAEKAHEMALRAIERLQRADPLLALISFYCGARRNLKPTRVWGVDFPTWVGVAAGLDKNALMLPFLQALGAGFVSVGTVLPRPQAGNPRPRLFRLLEYMALINRLGFNSDGAEAVATNLFYAKPHLQIPLMGSLGKMKETPNEEAVGDYIQVLEWLWDLVEILVANISSPNTPGLRELQGGRYLENFVTLLVQANKDKARRSNRPPKPLLVKVAPDLLDEELAEVIGICEDAGVDGFVIGNTTLSRPFFDPQPPEALEAGGLSGAPLFDLMCEKVTFAVGHSKLPIAAAGGINSLERGEKLRDLGVALCKVHTPVVFQGAEIFRTLKQAA